MKYGIYITYYKYVKEILRTFGIKKVRGDRYTKLDKRAENWWT